MKKSIGDRNGMRFRNHARERTEEQPAEKEKQPAEKEEQPAEKEKQHFKKRADRTACPPVICGRMAGRAFRKEIIPERLPADSQ